MYCENKPRKYYKLIKFVLCVDIRKIVYEIEFDLEKVYNIVCKLMNDNVEKSAHWINFGENTSHWKKN